MNMHSLRRSTGLVAAFAATSLLSWAGAATAAPSDGEALKTVVSYGDLNLDRPEGIAKLYQRIAYAAERVCAPLESRELQRMSEWRKCVNGAVSRAVVDINVPALTAYVNARNGAHSSGAILAARGQ